MKVESRLAVFLLRPHVRSIPSLALRLMLFKHSDLGEYVLVKGEVLFSGYIVTYYWNLSRSTLDFRLSFSCQWFFWSETGLKPTSNSD